MTRHRFAGRQPWSFRTGHWGRTLTCCKNASHVIPSGSGIATFLQPFCSASQGQQAHAGRHAWTDAVKSSCAVWRCTQRGSLLAGRGVGDWEGWGGGPRWGCTCEVLHP